MTADPECHVIIGRRLRRWRTANFISQADLARSLDLHREAISEIEHGRRKLTFVEANVLRRRHGLAFAHLIKG